MKREDDIFDTWLHQKRNEDPPAANDGFADRVLSRIGPAAETSPAVWLLRIACALAAAALGLLRIEFLTYFIASAN